MLNIFRSHAQLQFFFSESAVLKFVSNFTQRSSPIAKILPMVVYVMAWHQTANEPLLVPIVTQVTAVVCVRCVTRYHVV